MKTPFITVFVVCILMVAIPLLFYDYIKRGARPQIAHISKSDAYRLKEIRESGDKHLRGQIPNYEKAIEEYERFLKGDPRDAHVHNDLGTAY